MRDIKVIFLLIFFISVFLGNQNNYGQYLRNPSLEGSSNDSPPPDYWDVIHDWSDPDNFTGYYNTDPPILPVDGDIFILLRARGITYAEQHHAPLQREYLFQELATPLPANSCFRFEVYLSFTDENYYVADSVDPDHGYPVKFQVWGSNTPGGRDQLLVDTDPITNREWEKFTFYFITHNNSYAYILIEANWDTINVKNTPYNGMVLVDNLDLDYTGVMDTVFVDTVYYHGDSQTLLTGNSDASYHWTPDEYLYPNDSRSTLMLEYYETISAYGQQENECLVELFHIILDCDTLYPNFTHRSTEYYFKYDTLLELRASEGLIYSWEPQTNLTAYDIQAPHMIDYYEHYMVSITDKYNCSFQEEFNIILHCDTLYPEGSIVILDTTLEEEEAILLVPRYGEVISNWNPPKYLDCIDCQTPTASPRYSINYSVELTDEFECIHEEIFSVDVNLHIPNVITPNGDGYNDCLRVSGIPENSKLLVFEKNGSLKYEQNPFHSDICWEGIDKQGHALKAGTYWYAIEHPVLGTLKKGFILIKR